MITHKEVSPLIEHPVRIIGKKPIFKGTNENSVDQKKRILLNKDISMFKGK